MTIFGNFLTFNWQFSGGSDVDSPECELHHHTFHRLKNAMSLMLKWMSRAVYNIDRVDTQDDLEYEGVFLKRVQTKDQDK